MLYDPKWEKPEVKADPFSLQRLIAWLETQPADDAYDYCDPSACLVAKYLIAAGQKHFVLMSTELQAIGWLELVNPTVTEPRGDTYGAALKRARAIAARGY